MKLRPLAALALALATAPPAAAEVRALLVGVGEYPPEAGPSLPTLGGPPNDVQLMRSLLVERLGVPAGNVVTLVDEKATSRGIQDAFRSHLIRDCGEDDVAVFFFAGHGLQVDDLGPDADEADGLDEALVPYDYDELDPATWLTDDMVHRLLAAVPSRHVLVMFDCCHAGTGTRSIGGPFKWAGTRSTDTVGIGMREKGAAENHVFLAACRDGEKARPMYDEDLRAKVGVFTHSFCDLLAAKTKDASLDEFEKALRREVDREVKRLAASAIQTPVIEAARRDFSLADFLKGKVFTGGSAAGTLPDPALDPGPLQGFTPAGELQVTLTTDKPTYVWTEELTAVATVDRPAYLRIVHVDAKGSQTQLYPNKLQPQRLLKAGERVSIPPPGKKLRITGPEQGVEMLIAVASEKPFTDKEANVFGKAWANALPETTAAGTMSRGIVVEPRNPGAPPRVGGGGGTGQAVRIFRVSQF